MKMAAKLLALLIAAPSAAQADLTAIYAAPNARFKMTIEIAANGDLRGDVDKPGMYFITRAAHGYMIKLGPSGPIVSRVEDISVVMGEQMTKLDPQFREQMAQAPALVIVNKGVVTVNGRSGDAYYIQNADGALSSAPNIVISHDPALAPLATAMARQFDMSMQTMMSTMPTGPFKSIAAVLKTGAPIVFTGAELQSVTTAPIPASEFELPAKPETLDQVRQRMMSEHPQQ